MKQYAEYARKLREEIHMYPEIGFDLPKTLALVHRELDSMGIAHTDKWGRSSVVGYIGKEDAPITIGLRADMDALPVKENTDFPFKSRHEGIMHACGHDAHTAILLASAKWLKEHESELRCRVKLLFTPAEEDITPGRKELAENGVMDDVDFAIAIHVDVDARVGQVVCPLAPTHANSMGFKCRFYGKSAHAGGPHRGVDAIMMAMQAISAMQTMVNREIDPIKPTIFNIGSFHGGHTNNLVCDFVEIFGSSRAQEDEITEHMTRRLKEITENVAAGMGGRGEFEVTKLLPYVINHPLVGGQIRRTAHRLLGDNYLYEKPRKMGGEDFGFLSRKKPCAQFRLGVKPLDYEGKMPAAHNDNFWIDDGCFEVGVKMFTGFVLDAQDGIEGL